MKINNETYQYMKNACQKVVNHSISIYGFEYIKEYYQNNTLLFAWRVWNKAYDDIKTSDKYPNFEYEDRLVAYNPSFDIYANGINDNHIETALKRICKELLNK